MREIQLRWGQKSQIARGGEVRGVVYEWAFLSRGIPLHD